MRVLLVTNHTKAEVYDRREVRNMHGSDDFKSFFTVFTTLSAWPLLWGYRGLLVECTNPYDAAKSANSLELYCGPLSLQSISGMSYRAKNVFSALMTLIG